MTLDVMDIQAKVKKEAIDLLHRIEQADGLFELTSAGGMAEGFMKGINCLKALPPSDADALDILFSRALDRKMALVRR
jgi:hypothetical protein